MADETDDAADTPSAATAGEDAPPTWEVQISDMDSHRGWPEHGGPFFVTRSGDPGGLVIPFDNISDEKAEGIAALVGDNDYVATLTALYYALEGDTSIPQSAVNAVK